MGPKIIKAPILTSMETNINLPNPAHVDAGKPGSPRTITGVGKQKVNIGSRSITC